MTDIIDFAMFGIMTGLFSAIGQSIAHLYVEPHMENHSKEILKRMDEIKTLIKNPTKKEVNDSEPNGLSFSVSHDLN